MTPEQQALGERTRTAALDLLKHVPLLTIDPTEQAMALITAATVIIEREVGTALAPGALLGLVEPSIQAWQAQLGPEADTGTRH